MPSKSRKRTTKKKVQQRWNLWITAGAVVLVGVGFTLYQQTVSSSLLKSQASISCHIAKITASTTGKGTITRLVKPRSFSGSVEERSIKMAAAADALNKAICPARTGTLSCSPGCKPSGDVSRPGKVLDDPYCWQGARVSLNQRTGRATATATCKVTCTWGQACAPESPTYPIGLPQQPSRSTLKCMVGDNGGPSGVYREGELVPFTVTLDPPNAAILQSTRWRLLSGNSYFSNEIGSPINEGQGSYFSGYGQVPTGQSKIEFRVTATNAKGTVGCNATVTK